MKVIKITASTHQIYSLTPNQKKKTGGIYDNLAMPFNDEDKAYLFNAQEDYNLIGREIPTDKAFRL